MSEAEAQLARAILSKNLKVRRGESVLIESWAHSLPYVSAFVEESRRLGARPSVLYEDEKAWWDAVESGRLSGFKSLSDVEREAVEASDVYVYFWGPEDRPRLDGLPDKVQDRLTGYNEEWYRRAKRAGLRGVRMMVGLATDPVASTFGLNGEKWRKRLIEAGGADGARMRAKGTRLADAVKNGRRLRIRHPGGTDLRLKLSGVKSRLDTGIVEDAAMKRPYGMMTNNPSGQVMFSIDGSEPEGTVVSNRPVYIGPNKFGGMRWTFKDGQLTEQTCRLGGKPYLKQYKAAPKGKDQLGFLSIGLNPRSRELPPCEDTEEGAALIGIGNNGFAGGKIRIPFQGYALVGGPRIEVDGMTVASGGRVR
jgi:leucyl aminopeptidase (aminopeptidase T)